MSSAEETNQKAEEIEAIYENALARLKVLKEEQSRIIDGFINSLKSKRLAELKKLIAGPNSDQ